MNDIVIAKLSQEERQAFDDVDSIISRAVTIGDPLLAFEYGTKLRRRQEVEGLALAKLLYRLRESWNLFEVAGISDDLLTMAEMEMGVRPATTKKYIDMWESIFENAGVPDDVKAILAGRPIGDLLLLTAAVGEGTLVGDDLKSAALAGDKSELREFVTKARGLRTSAKSAIRIFLNRVDRSGMKAGTLFAKQGDTREVLDFRAYVNGEASDLAEKAINRIINAAGIQELFN